MTPRTRDRLRVAVVVQRYGADIVGGAEAHARRLIEVLAEHHDLTVLTSCARDTGSWTAVWPAGPSHDQGWQVERYAHPVRNVDGRARVPLRHKLRYWSRALLDAAGAVRVPRPGDDAEADGLRFLRRQGPTCDGLIEALRQGRERWDVVVFFTALYHPTAVGLPVWGRRSVLVPTLHDEKAMYLPIQHRVFGSAGMVLWNTRAEQRLAARLYGASAPTGRVVGVGVAARTNEDPSLQQARSRWPLPRRYLVYVGRLESGKGCEELAGAWLAVAERVPDAWLIWVGKGPWQPPDHPQMLCTGFVEDAERDGLIAGANALVMPSRLESLSLVLLEAMALGVPVLANARCEPLQDHVTNSAAGETYHDRCSLRAGLLSALTRTASEREILGQKGRAYIRENYSHELVHAAWLDAVEYAAGADSAGE